MQSSKFLKNISNCHKINNIYKCIYLNKSANINGIIYKQRYATATSTPEKCKDPFSFVRNDIARISLDIRNELNTTRQPLRDISHYHFDGKAIRPMIVLLVAKCCNLHSSADITNDVETRAAQRRVAMIAEMIHTASLVHDDVIDDSDTRRGRLSVQKNWGQRNPTDKIQSGNGDLCLKLKLVPKMLMPLVKDWVPDAFVISFKLETDPNLLESKSRKALSIYKHQIVIANILCTRKFTVNLYTRDGGCNTILLDEEARARGDEIESDIIARVSNLHDEFMQ